jgi:outer membrane protein OmpA-like peptidoglycan-associated protein
MKKRLLGLLFVFCAFGLKAQEFLPFISSPYAGVTAGKLNPASIAGSRYKFDVTVLGGSTGVHNDLLMFSRKNLIFNTSFYGDLLSNRSDLFSMDLNSDLRKTVNKYLTGDHLFSDWDKDTYGGFYNGQIDVLNLMFAFNDRFSLAAGYSKRWQASFNALPKEVASEALGTKIPVSQVYDKANFTDKTTGALSVFNQVFLTGAYSIVNTDPHRLKLGVTAKLLFGGVSAYAYAENYSGTLSGSDRGLEKVTGKAGMSDNSGGTGKVGFGFDAGVEYEYRPSSLAGNEVAEYRLKVGASILDLGGFGSRDGAPHQALKPGFGIPRSFQQLLDRYGDGRDLGSYTIGLPTVITASVDYRIGSTPFFVNFTPYIALGKTTEAKVANFNSYNLIPHAEWKNFGVSVPLQYDQYGKFTAGLGVRAWKYVWLGSNTLFKNVFTDKNYSADVHVMLKVPISPSTEKDRDKDGILDKDDRCPDLPGLKKYQGCPDTDGDGIPDDQDGCPNEAGPAATNGCPDRDGDGIPDKDDRCPDQVGAKELQGCPDRDGDGIADIDDACPDQSGPRGTRGCPDRDGDGVADKDDRCPDQAGSAALKGCPDRDGDGVPDMDDECPDQSGVASNKGCPSSAPAATKIQNVEFDIDKFNIKPQYHAELDKVVDAMAKNPNATVKVVGHTDITYTHAYNMQLSKRRAQAIKDYLVKKNVDAKRIATEGYGPDKPIADNNTVDGRARNRRSEITIVIK